MVKKAPVENEKLTLCPNVTGLFFVDKLTGAVKPVPCDKYTCEYCGPRKIYRLKCGLIEALSGKSLKLFTFTFTNRFHESPIQHNEVMRAAWHNFLRSLRRHRLLTDHQKKVAFFRVTEQHKSGFTHFHVIFTTFLPVTVLQDIWASSVATALGFVPTSHFAHVDISSFKPGRASRGISKAAGHNKHAVNYVLKYLVKSFAEGKALSGVVSTEVVGDDILQRETEASVQKRTFSRRLRRYSKSNSLVLFPKQKDQIPTSVVCSYSKGQFKQLHTQLYLYQLGITAQFEPVLIGSSWHFPLPFHFQTRNEVQNPL